MGATGQPCRGGLQSGHDFLRTVGRNTAQPKGAALVTETTEEATLCKTLELRSRGGKPRNHVAVAAVKGGGVPTASPGLSSLSPKQAKGGGS